MKFIQRELITLYLKYFLIVLLALELFFVGIDFMQKSKELSDSANIQLLYILYNLMYALNFTLPLAIVLSFILFQVNLIKSNQFIALYSIGYSKNQLLKPILGTTLAISLLYVGLNFTPFAYAKERVDSILNGRYLLDSKSDLFLKHSDNYIYFEKLYPFKKSAENIKIFKIENGDLESVISAKKAIFLGNSWRVLEASVVKKPSKLTKGSKLELEQNRTFEILRGFKPKIIDNVYEAKASFSILDAIDAIELLSIQNIDISKVKAILLSITIFPLFAPLAIIFIFFKSPISSRFKSLILFSSISIFATLSLWGFLFSLVKLSISGVLYPEFAIVAPILLLFTIALIIFYQNR